MKVKELNGTLILACVAGGAMKAMFLAAALLSCAPHRVLLTEWADEIVECEDPDHRIPVWCRSGAGWSRCGNTQCPTRCSEGHIVRCSCCQSGE